MFHRLFLLIIMFIAPEVEHVEEKKDEEEQETPPIFSLYPFLPNELKMKVVSKMELVDRYRYSQCSDFCYQQAKEHITPVTELSIRPSYLSSILITVKNSTSLDTNASYTIQYFRRDPNEYYRTGPERNLMFQENKMKEVMEAIELDDDVDIDAVALQRFKSLLRRYQHQIKKLEICFKPYRTTNFDFEINNLKNLEELRIDYYSQAPQILSKTSEKLKAIYLTMDDESTELIENFEPIYRALKLALPSLKINSEQFKKFSASVVGIHIGELTEYDIFNFVESWRTGELGRPVRLYQWLLNDSNFDVALFFSLLDVDYDGSSQIHYCVENINGHQCLLSHSLYEGYDMLSFEFIFGRPNQRFRINMNQVIVISENMDIHQVESNPADQGYDSDDDEYNLVRLD